MNYLLKYKNLEKEYTKIFKTRVMPYLKKNIKHDFRSAPVYYLLNGLNINRFRSGLPMIIAKEFNSDERKMIPLSAFCELTFNTAMAQDDFYDNDKNREGLEATHIKFGVKETLLSCDYMNYQIVLALIKNLKKHQVSTETINAVLEIINLELSSWSSSVQMEINSRKDLIRIDKNYLKELYLSKTAHGRMLLECSFMIVLNHDYEIFKLIQKYSKHLALAGQLKNDIYDFTKHKKFLVLSDLRQRHITWPLYLLLKCFKKNLEKKYVIAQLNNKNYAYLIKMLKKHKIIEKILKLINYHVEKAKKLIKNNNTKFTSNLSMLLITWAEGNRHFSKEPRL